MEMQRIKELAVVLALSLPLTAAASMKETAIQISGPQGPLAGSLLSSERNAAVVIIVAGSGPTDRNGNSRETGLTPWTYKMLAQGLATQGIASLRFDKRAVRASAGAIVDIGQIIIEDYASDVRAWADLLRQRLPGTPIWILGHSQGGLIALLAAQDNPTIHGVVLVATAGRSLDQVIVEQLQRHPEYTALVAPASTILRSLKAGEPVEDQHIVPVLQPIMRREVQSLLISELARDPAQLIAQTTQPVLIVQGGQDLQITQTDANLLKAAKQDAHLVILEHANHVLKDVPVDDRQANFAAYSNPQLPLAKGLMQALSSFILAKQPAHDPEPHQR